MAKEDNIATQEKLGEAVNTGNLVMLDEVFAEDVVDHDPAPDQGPGPAGFRDFFTSLRTAFPDLAITVDCMVCDDDAIAIAYTMTGTQQGPFKGIEPTNKQISARGVQIARFNEDAKIAERWGSSDELGIIQQLQQ